MYPVFVVLQPCCAVKAHQRGDQHGEGSPDAGRGERCETREQLELLQQQHCLEGQGYYFSRPVAPVELSSYRVAG